MIVRCSHCGGTYDLGRVEVIARYADATVFDAPCCKRQVDDRSWKGRPDFYEIEANVRTKIRQMYGAGS